MTALTSELENAYLRFRRPFNVIKTETSISFWDRSQPQIVHLLGSLDAPEDALIGERERRAARFRRPLLEEKMADLLSTSTLLFIGFEPFDDLLENMLVIASDSIGRLRRSAYITMSRTTSDLAGAMYQERGLIKIEIDSGTPAEFGRSLLERVQKAAADRTTLTPYDPHIVAECETQLKVIGWAPSSSRWLSERSIETVFEKRSGEGNRLIVHSVDGEITAADVHRMTERLPAAAEGMLITDTRISNMATRLAAKDSRIRLHTRRSLFECILGNSTYMQSIVSDYLANDQQHRYVALQCLKQDDTYWLDDYTDSWLRERSRNQLTILGDPGSGKSWFCRHIAFGLANKRLADPDNSRIPILVNLQEMEREGSLEKLITDQMEAQGAVLHGGFHSFRYANESGQLVIILDGLDELRMQLSPEQAAITLSELSSMVGPASKIILTSRPGYFERDSGGMLGAVEGLTMDITGSATFELIRIAELGYEQRMQLLIRRLGPNADNVRTTIDNSSALTDLARLPGLLDLLSIVLPDRSRKAPLTASELFEQYVAILLDSANTLEADRDIVRLASVAGTMHEDARQFLPAGQVRALLGATGGTSRTISSDPRWESFLRVGADGNVRFRLKTMREFLAARHIRACLASGDTGPLERRLLLPELLRYLAEQLYDDQLDPLNYLADSAPRGHLAANCISLANRMDVSFAGRNFRGMQLRGADLENGDVRRADFRDCDLRGVQFQGCKVSGADFRGAQLHGAIVHETNVVTTVCIEPMEKTVIAATADKVVHLLDASDLRRMQTIPTSNVFRSMIIMKEGRYVVTAGLDGSVCMADLLTSQAFFEIAHHGAPVTSAIAISSDTFATGGTDGIVRVWSLNGEMLRDRRVCIGYVRALAITPNGRRLIAGCTTGTVTVVDEATLEPIRTWSPHVGASVYSLCLIPDKGMIATGSDDRRIRLFSFPDAEHVSDLSVEGDTVLQIVHPASSDHLFTGCRDGTITRWLLTDLEKSWTYKQSAPVLSMAIGAGQTTIVTAGADGVLRSVDYNSGAVLHETLLGHRAEFDWRDVDLRGTTGWNREWLRFMADRGAVVDIFDGKSAT
ncbi:NACHT domain-containing protein [Nocardia sp. R16R-3T]